MSRKLRTEEDLRRKLESDLSRVLPDGIWKLLVNDGYVEGCLDGTGDFTYRDVLNRCRLLLSCGVGETEGRALLRRRMPREHNLPPDRRLSALTEIWAAEAGRRVSVIAFREKILGGRLLTWGEARTWIEKQAQDEGRSTMWVQLPLPEGCCPAKLHGLDWFSLFAGLPDDEKKRWPVSWSCQTLAYASEDGFVLRTRIARCGVLGTLKWIATNLTREFPLWREHDAVMFVLTGIPPVLPRASAGVKRALSGPPRIIMEVDISLSPKEVARLYTQMRREARRDASLGKDRPMTEKHLHLAVYLAEHFETPWEPLMESWNGEYPDWAYTNWRTFARDAKAAWCRVTGREWTPRQAGRRERIRDAKEEG